MGGGGEVFEGASQSGQRSNHEFSCNVVHRATRLLRVEHGLGRALNIPAITCTRNQTSRVYLAGDDGTDALIYLEGSGTIAETINYSGGGG